MRLVTNRLSPRLSFSAPPRSALTCLLLFRACIAFLDTRRFAAQVAKVVELGTTHFAASDDIDMVDHGSVKRKNALDADTKANLSHGHCLANAAVLNGDANS